MSGLDGRTDGCPTNLGIAPKRNVAGIMCADTAAAVPAVRPPRPFIG